MAEDNGTTDDAGTDDVGRLLDDESIPQSVRDSIKAEGKKAIDAERASRKEAERAMKKANDELDALRKSTQPETDKAVAQARAEVRQEVLAEANARLLKTEIRAAAAGKLADPGDAAALLGDLDRFVDKNGEPDPKAIASAIDALVKTKPYLAAAGTRAGALPGGGAKPSTGFSINDEIRAQAGRA